MTQSLRNPVFPTPLFFAAISVSTWYGGGFTGLLAVAFATLALDYYFIPPEGSLSLSKPQLPYLLEFALPALLTCWFVKKRRVAETELRLEVQERQAELARVSRMLTVGEMGVSVAHEINQPLMAVVLNGDACLRWLGADPPNMEEVRKSVGRMVDEGARAGEIVRRIRALSGKAAPQREAVDLNELVGEAVALLERETNRHRVFVRTDLGKDLPVISGDRVQLQQVIFNLGVNAAEAMSAMSAMSATDAMENRPRELRIRTHSDGAGRAVVTVEDSGPGLPTGDPERLFSAFFTTKKDGVGIGLSISRTIVEGHGGRLWAGNSARGAVFQFELPCA